MKAIYKLYIDCGRMGTLEGVFVAEKEKLNNLIGKHIYYGEVLGKHSEVYGNLEKEEVTMVTDDENVVKLFETYDLSSGINPFHYIDEE